MLLSLGTREAAAKCECVCLTCQCNPKYQLCSPSVAQPHLRPDQVPSQRDENSHGVFTVEGREGCVRQNLFPFITNMKKQENSVQRGEGRLTESPEVTPLCYVSHQMPERNEVT